MIYHLTIIATALNLDTVTIGGHYLKYLVNKTDLSKIQSSSFVCSTMSSIHRIHLQKIIYCCLTILAEYKSYFS